MDSTVQVLKSSSEVCLVVLPRQTIHTRRGVSFEFEERLSEKIDADVMEERGEFLLLPFLRHFPYALQRLCHVSPVLRPARALLARIPLGPRPWLHRLRRGWRLRGLLRGGLLRFVRRLHSLYEATPVKRFFAVSSFSTSSRSIRLTGALLCIKWHGSYSAWPRERSNPRSP